MTLSEILKELFRIKLGQSLSRSARELDEVFLFFMFADYFGLPNPYRIHLLECMPLLIEEFHNWHKRMGLKTSPLEWITCC